MTIITGGVLVLVTGVDDCSDLPDTISELLEDLGIEVENSLPLDVDF